MLQMDRLNKSVLRAQESRSCLAFFLENPAIRTDVVLDKLDNEYANASDRPNIDTLLLNNSAVCGGDA